MFGMFLFFFSCVIFLLSRAIFVVKQQWSYIIERFGKFHEVANPGLNIKVSFVDRIANKVPSNPGGFDKVMEEMRNSLFTSIRASQQQ